MSQIFSDACVTINAKHIHSFFLWTFLCSSLQKLLPLYSWRNHQSYRYSCDFCVFLCKSLTVLHSGSSSVHKYSTFCSRLSWPGLILTLCWLERHDLRAVIPSPKRALVPPHVEQICQLGHKILLFLSWENSPFFVCSLAWFIVVFKSKSNFLHKYLIHELFCHLVQSILWIFLAVLNRWCSHFCLPSVSFPIFRNK